MSTPEQIQRDIEGTRRALSTDVDRLAEKVSPGKVVGRRVDRVKSGFGGLRDKVMGSMPDPHQVKSQAGGAASNAASTVSDKASSAASTVGDAASSAASTVSEAVTNAPQAVRQHAQGNPLGAGLVAFGLGLVISSLIPATEREKQLASQAEEKARGPLQEKAKEIAGELKEPAQQAAQQVKETASSGASHTMEQARSAAEDVKAPLQQ